MAPRRPARRAPRRHPARKSHKSSLVKTIKRVVVREEKRMLETKYVAQAAIDNQPVKPTFTEGGTSFSLTPCIPEVFLGNESHQRVGTRISPTRCYIKGQLDFDPTFQNNFDGWVRFFVVTNKAVKSYTQQKAITDATFLDIGNGATSSWVASTPSISACQPVSNENWTQLAQKTYRMYKNVGQTTGSATNTYATNTGASSHLFQIPVKLPKTLIYSDSTVEGDPNNHAIWLAAVYWTSDSTLFEGNVIRMTLHSHMFYKDA